MLSTHIGQASRLKSIDKPTCLPIFIRLCTEGFEILPLSLLSLALGVGNNPNPVSLMRRTNVGSWNAVPFRVIPDLGQVSEYSSKPSSPVATNEVCDVFHDCVSRLYLANKTGKLGP